MSDSTIAKVALNGPFRLETKDGTDLTPKAQKAQALLALLLVSPRGERSRNWVRSMLWSDRGAEQAAASLRQSLAQIKKALGAFQHLITADRHKVYFDLSAVEITDDKAASATFLEGIDAKDPAFSNWLSGERAARGAQGQGALGSGFHPSAGQYDARRWAIFIEPECEDNPPAQWFGQLFADACSRHIREFFSVHVTVNKAPTDDPHHWRLRLATHTMSPKSLGVRLSLENAGTGQQYWSGHRQLDLTGAPPLEHPDLLRLVNELVEAIGDVLIAANPNDAHNPDRICRAAIRSLFSMDANSVDRADRMFAQAFEQQPRGLYLAWRAQVRTIQSVEKHIRDKAQLTNEAEYFAAKAMELEPNNSMVLATLANTNNYLLGSAETSLDMAKRSVALNPANPMGWWALSSANVYTGNLDESYQNAKTARRLAILSPHRFWWDNQQFGAAAVVGRLDEAILLAQAAHAQNKNFCPPLRYLVAFLANAGLEEEARAAVLRLMQLETDFSVERLIDDREYPASLLRRTPGIDMGKLEILRDG